MKRFLLHSSVIAATLGLFSASVIAAEQPTQPAQPEAAHALPSFETLDTNKDSVITLPEMDVYGGKALKERLVKCDKDKNSELSRSEYEACRRAAADTLK